MIEQDERPTMTEEEFQAHLVRACIICDLPMPLAEREASDIQPVKVEGKPLSEAVIEERQ